MGQQVSLTLLADLPKLGRLNRSRSPPGQGGPIQPGQRAPAGQGNCLGAVAASVRHALHGSVGGYWLEPSAPGLLPTPAGNGQIKEAGAHGVDSEARGHPGQHGENRCVEIQSSQRLDIRDSCFSLTIDTSAAWAVQHDDAWRRSRAGTPRYCRTALENRFLLPAKYRRLMVSPVRGSASVDYLTPFHVFPSCQGRRQDDGIVDSN